nr:IS256 family transposase [Legionella jordanis]
MKDCSLKPNSAPAKENCVEDPLTEVLRQGAKELIMKAVEAELSEMLSAYSEVRLLDGRPAVVRNGYLPARQIQTGIGEVEVQVPKVRDRSGSGIHFNSQLLPPYLRRTKSMEELIPWLYLKGLSTGDYTDALSALVGESARGLSANTVSRLKEKWLDEHKEWQRQDLRSKRYVYWWADGIYSKVRMDDKLCLLVIIGVTESGLKELVAVCDGYRESTASWEEVLLNLRQRGLPTAPKLAIGDGALGFWGAISKVYPETRHQRCWVHKTANVLNKLPKSMQPKVKASLHEIWMAEKREDAYKAFDNTVALYSAKYPKAMECLVKDKEELLAFYDFPAEHWIHIRTTNPIESAFSTVRLRTHKSRNCGSRDTTLAMVFKLMEVAQKRWIKIRGFNLLTLVINNVKFVDGVQISKQSDRVAA